MLIASGDNLYYLLNFPNTFYFLIFYFYRKSRNFQKFLQDEKCCFFSRAFHHCWGLLFWQIKCLRWKIMKIFVEICPSENSRSLISLIYPCMVWFNESFNLFSIFSKFFCVFSKSFQILNFEAFHEIFLSFSIFSNFLRAFLLN